MGKIILSNVREYCEGMEVFLQVDQHSERLCVFAFNEGGHNGTAVDLLDLITWLKTNRPDLLS